MSLDVFLFYLFDFHVGILPLKLEDGAQQQLRYVGMKQRTAAFMTPHVGTKFKTEQAF